MSISSISSSTAAYNSNSITFGSREPVPPVDSVSRQSQSTNNDSEYAESARQSSSSNTGYIPSDGSRGTKLNIVV